jgi:hypothetical protein
VFGVTVVEENEKLFHARYTFPWFSGQLKRSGHARIVYPFFFNIRSFEFMQKINKDAVTLLYS